MIPCIFGRACRENKKTTGDSNSEFYSKDYN